jgi:mevalonate kinase
MIKCFQFCFNFGFRFNLRCYSLGSRATDELVRLAKSLGPERGLFGAKITGGGSGGTVCVLGRSDGSGAAAVAELCQLYEAGHSIVDCFT